MFGFNLKSKFRMKLFIFHTVSSPIQFCIFCIHKVVWRKSTKNRLSISKYHNIIVAIIKEKSSNLFALRCPTGQRVAFLYTTRSFLCWMTGRPSSRPSWASPKRKRILKSDLGTFWHASPTDSPSSAGSGFRHSATTPPDFGVFTRELPIQHLHAGGSGCMRDELLSLFQIFQENDS